MNAERLEAAHLLRDLGRDARTIAANIPELSESEAGEFLRTGKLPGHLTRERQLTLFPAKTPEKKETRHGGKPCGPMLAFAKPSKETDNE